MSLVTVTSYRRKLLPASSCQVHTVSVPEVVYWLPGCRITGTTPGVRRLRDGQIRSFSQFGGFVVTIASTCIAPDMLLLAVALCIIWTPTLVSTTIPSDTVVPAYLSPAFSSARVVRLG